MTHAKFSASGAHRWFRCPGSIRFIDSLPDFYLDNSSEFSDEGTEAHELAEKCLVQGLQAKEITDNPELAECIQLYLDTVRARIGPLSELLVEHRFKIDVDKFGTNDAIVFSDDELHVFDYKHGAGVPVEIVGNKQLKYYAVGALKELKIKPEFITINIVQPRCAHKDGPVRSQTLSIKEIYDFEKEIFEKAEAAQKPDAPLVAGVHCKFCAATAVCPRFKDYVIGTQNHIALAENYEIAERLSTWRASITRVVTKLLHSGQKVPGFKLVEKRSQRKWVDERKLAKELRDNHELFKLRTPAQVEKILKDNFDDSWTFKPKGELTIAREDDKRPATTKAAAIFADVKPG